MSGQQQTDGTRPVRVRAATSADVGTTVEVWRAAWLDGHRGHIPDELLAARGPEYFARLPP